MTDPIPKRRCFQFNLAELCILMAFIAGAIAVYRSFKHPATDVHLKSGVCAAVYIALFSVATVAVGPWKSLRRPLVVFILFGWTFLLFVLWTSGNISSVDIAKNFASTLKFGLAIGVLAMLAAQLCYYRLD